MSSTQVESSTLTPEQLAEARRISAAHAGKVGGKVRSEAKTAANRIKASKGGWPKGKPRGPQFSAAKLQQMQEKMREWKMALEVAGHQAYTQGDTARLHTADAARAAVITASDALRSLTEYFWTLSKPTAK